MELVYTWIKGYKNIKECAIALNSEFINTQITIDASGMSCIVLVKNNHSTNIFDKKLNMLAIVGQNGSGKSNLTSAIAAIVRSNMDIEHKHSKDNNYFDIVLPKEYCLIWSDNDNFYYVGSSDYKITAPNGKKVNKKNIKTKCAMFKPFLLEPDEEVLNFPKDLHQNEIIDKKLDNYFYYDRFRIYDTAKSLRAFFDTGKNLKVIQDSENSNLKFDSYGYEIDIKQEFTWLNRQLRRACNNYLGIGNNKKNNNYSIRKQIDSLIARNNVIARNIKTMNNFDLAITAGCFSFGLIKLINLLEIYHASKDILGGCNFKGLIECLKFKQGLISRHKFFINFWESSINIIKHSKQTITKNDLEELLETFEAFKQIEEDLCINKNFFDTILQPVGDGLFRLTKLIKLSDELPEEIDRLNKLKIFRLNFYKGSQDNIYSFFELSTGEQRMLRFFADIVSVIDKSDIFIFDEMDLSWHPEWQRKMIYYMHDLFKQLSFNKKRIINIIFTTHSPFILSDLPKDNVIIMNNGSAKYANFETFASNIHDLFNKNLFLNCESCYTIGEFAKNEIKKIANSLNKNSFSEKNLLKLENKISMIGEPIIRISLLKKLYSNPHYIDQNEDNTQLRVKIFELTRQLNEKDRT